MDTQKKTCNYFKKYILFLLILITFITNTAYSANTGFNSLLQEKDLRIVLDNDNITTLPEHLRSTNKINQNLSNSNLNLNGLSDLNISGSQQFSTVNIKEIIKYIDTDLKITDVDLRQESHGFINEYPVSFESITNGNKANKGLTLDQVLENESQLLNSITLNEPLFLSNDDTKEVIPKSVNTEKQIADINKLTYFRVPVTDTELPDAAVIDYFIKGINVQNKSWYHFHCKEGIGRTTTFMIMYDMMRNNKIASVNDIVNRQIKLVTDFSNDDISLLNSGRRNNFYNVFFNYCKNYSPEYKVSFSQYLKDNNITI